MKILMVLTSHNQLGNTGRTTGFWLEEFAAPYFVFRDAGAELTLASPKGEQPPIDPKSDLPENQTPAMMRFKKDKAAQEALANTVKLSSVKSEDVADELLRLGAIFEKIRNWEPFSIVDGRLVTGQNPASAGEFRRDQKAILTPQELAKQMEEVAARHSGYVK